MSFDVGLSLPGLFRLDGKVKEHIDAWSGILEISHIGDRKLDLSESVFFHASNVWIQEDSCHSLTRFCGAEVKNNLPIGTRVNLSAKPVTSSYFNFGSYCVWPKTIPESPQLPNESKAQLDFFIKDFERVPPRLVQATFPQFPIKDSLPGQAVIRCIVDDEYGIIELQGDQKSFKFMALFHKSQIWFLDHQALSDHPFLSSEPLSRFVKVGQEVCLSARSIVISSGAELQPSILELQAIAVSLDPLQMPVTAPRPTILHRGTGAYGVCGTSSWYFFKRSLHSDLNHLLITYLKKHRKLYPDLNPKCINDDFQALSREEGAKDSINQKVFPAFEISASTSAPPMSKNLYPEVKPVYVDGNIVTSAERKSTPNEQLFNIRQKPFDEKLFNIKQETFLKINQASSLTLNPAFVLTMESRAVKNENFASQMNLHSSGFQGLQLNPILANRKTNVLETDAAKLETSLASEISFFSSAYLSQHKELQNSFKQNFDDRNIKNETLQTEDLNGKPNSPKISFLSAAFLNQHQVSNKGLKQEFGVIQEPQNDDLRYRLQKSSAPEISYLSTSYLSKHQDLRHGLNQKLTVINTEPDLNEHCITPLEGSDNAYFSNAYMMKQHELNSNMQSVNVDVERGNSTEEIYRETEIASSSMGNRIHNDSNTEPTLSRNSPLKQSKRTNYSSKKRDERKKENPESKTYQDSKAHCHSKSSRSKTGKERSPHILSSHKTGSKSSTSTKEVSKNHKTDLSCKPGSLNSYSKERQSRTSSLRKNETERRNSDNRSRKAEEKSRKRRRSTSKHGVTSSRQHSESSRTHKQRSSPQKNDSERRNNDLRKKIEKDKSRKWQRSSSNEQRRSTSKYLASSRQNSEAKRKNKQRSSPQKDDLRNKIEEEKSRKRRRSSSNEQQRSPSEPSRQNSEAKRKNRQRSPPQKNDSERRNNDLRNRIEEEKSRKSRRASSNEQRRSPSKHGLTSCRQNTEAKRRNNSYSQSRDGKTDRQHSVNATDEQKRYLSPCGSTKTLNTQTKADYKKSQHISKNRRSHSPSRRKTGREANNQKSSSMQKTDIRRSGIEASNRRERRSHAASDEDGRSDSSLSLSSASGKTRRAPSTITLSPSPTRSLSGPTQAKARSTCSTDSRSAARPATSKNVETTSHTLLTATNNISIEATSKFDTTTRSKSNTVISIGTPSGIIEETDVETSPLSMSSISKASAPPSPVSLSPVSLSSLDSDQGE